MKALACSLALASIAVAAPPKAEKSKASPIAPYYTVEAVPTPPGVAPEIGGIDAFPDGRVAVAFHHGQIGIYTPKTQSWEIFAEGLHEPLGLVVEKDGSLLVMQRPELTRLKSSTGKGPADTYETVWDDFGMTGNYHEFAFGPVRGPNGKLYIGLNVASNGDTIRPEVRGEWNPIGLPREKFYDTEWKKTGSKAAGRMYSRVPWRGWIMEIDPATGKGEPFAGGFRSPDGIGFDAQGNLLVDDNQGDWRGASELFVVKRGGFYGHPASLVWRKDWTGEDPLQVSVEKLNELRTPAAIWFPYGIFANSPTQILQIPKTPKWGPFGGQVLVGEMNVARILRVLPEEVDGVWQGACIAFIESEAVKRGGHRFAFTGDTLWMGRTHLSWAGAEGLATIKPTGKIPFDPLDMHVTPRGFRFDFTAPLDPASAADPALWKAECYTYAYHSTYGSPQMQKTEVVPTKVTLATNGKTVEVELPELKPDFVYDFNLKEIKAATGGATLLNPRIAYTLRRVPK